MNTSSRRSRKRLKVSILICAEKKSVLKKAQTPDSYNENEP